MDRSAAPRRVLATEAERVFFDPANNIYFLQRDSLNRYLHRLRAPEYTVNERVERRPVRYVFDVSPDGEWVAAVMDVPRGGGLQQVAISTRGLPTRVICGFCGGGAGPSRVMAPAISWTRDGRAMLISARLIAFAGMAGSRYSILVPVRPGAALPPLPPQGVAAADDYLQLSGARRVAHQHVFPGATPNQLFFYEATTIRNLYRVQLPN
jgi:hypothetical protein